MSNVSPDAKQWINQLKYIAIGQGVKTLWRKKYIFQKFDADIIG